MGLIADEHPPIAYLLDTVGKVHGKGMQSYLTMMAVRLLEMQRVLKPTGSIYLHCDPYASHYLKMLMDSIFIGGQFQNELIWHYGGGGASLTRWGRKHDVLLFYSKGTQWVFNADAVRTPHRWIDGQRRADGSERSIKKGKIADDVFRHNSVMPWARERTGYPTQKPLALLERIIKASSNEGDLVLDPFCGCATVCVAAERLNRQWVGIDISPKAVELVQYRLKQQEPGIALWASKVVARTDIPQRTDIDAPRNYRQNKHVLFGQQEGVCAGCSMDFPFKIFEVDHVVPRSKGGTNHQGNLQLLCPHCNRIKSDRPMEYLVAELARPVISTV